MELTALLIIWFSCILIFALPLIFLIIILVCGIFVSVVAFFAEIYFKFIIDAYRLIFKKN